MYTPQVFPLRWRRRLIAGMLEALLLVSPAFSLLPPERARVGASRSAPSLVFASDLFVFWSDSDINLHHFIYQWARAISSSGAGWAIPVPEIENFTKLSAAERSAWQKAVTTYQEELVNRDLLFDPEMVAIRDALVGMRPAKNLSPLGKAALTALASVRPIYRHAFWRDHDNANRRWIEAALPLVRGYEHSLSPRISRALGGDWPGSPIRVDVSAYANDLGAYATAEPHVTVSSRDKGYSRPWCLEMLLHESSHASSLAEPLMRDLSSAFEPLGRPMPRDLPHLFIFYTSGEVARQALTVGGVPDYKPYAESQHLYERVPGWGKIRDTLAQYWKPYLDGKAERQEAITAVAREIAGKGTRRLPLPSSIPPTAAAPAPTAPPSVERGPEWCGNHTEPHTNLLTSCR